jgi:hypothetical protein
VNSAKSASLSLQCVRSPAPQRGTARGNARSKESSKREFCALYGCRNLTEAGRCDLQFFDYDKSGVIDLRIGVTFCGAFSLPAVPIARFARSTSRTFNRRFGPETCFYCNLMVVKTSIIPSIECNRLDIELKS